MTAPIHLADLHKHFGDVKAVDGVSLDVEQGEIFGFLGLNGADKSTAIRTLLGFLHPTSGTAQVLGTFLLDSLTFDTDYEWLGDIAFARYYDPGEILVEGTIHWAGVAILLTATVVLVIVASELFERHEISA